MGSMDHMMHLAYVSFSYLFKINLGRKVVHWMGHLLVKTLVVIMSQCITPTFSPYFCLAHIFNRPVQCDEENVKNTGEPMPNFFLVLDFVFVFFFGGGGEGVDQR